MKDQDTQNTSRPVDAVAPAIRPDGSCPDCANGGGRICAYHSAEGIRKDREFWQSMRPRLEVARNAELWHIASRFEFETDQMQTWQQKAQRFIDAGMISPRF